MFVVCLCSTAAATPPYKGMISKLSLGAHYHLNFYVTLYNSIFIHGFVESLKSACYKIHQLCI